MDRGLRIFTGLILFLVLALVILQNTGPKPINWAPSYNIKEKTPLGLYILNQEMDNLFPEAYLERWDKSLYEYFRDDMIMDDEQPDAVLMINQDIFMDKASADKLLHFVSAGRSALLSAATFPGSLTDSLKIKLMYNYTVDSVELTINTDTSYVPAIEGAGIFSGNWFSADSSARYEILGYVCHADRDLYPNFIRVPYGQGYFYLHTEPAVFSNYTLLEGDQYLQAQHLLSLTDQPHILWYLKGQMISVISTSPLRYVKSQPALRLAWNLLIGGLIILMLFNAKRRQRPVPRLSRPVNTTEEFVKTISNLYQQEGSVRDIMDKKIIYTLEKIRSRFYISADLPEEEFIQKLHVKASKPIEDVRRMLFLINKHRDSDYICSHDDLTRLNIAIEKIL
jgi:hypothetical protein